MVGVENNFCLLVHREQTGYYIYMGPRARKVLVWISGAIVLVVMAISAIMAWGIWGALMID